MATSRKILIIEDEALLALELEAQLQDWGFDVIGWATNREEAVALAIDQAPELALVDIQLRGGDDGVQVAAELRASVGCDIVFLTAQSDAGTVERARAVPHRAYMRKPYRPHELLELLGG